MTEVQDQASQRGKGRTKPQSGAEQQRTEFQIRKEAQQREIKNIEAELKEQAAFKTKKGLSHEQERQPISDATVNRLIKENRHFLIFSRPTCPWSLMAKQAIRLIPSEFKTYTEIDQVPNLHSHDILRSLMKITKRNTVPQVFLGQKFQGTASEFVGREQFPILLYEEYSGLLRSKPQAEQDELLRDFVAQMDDPLLLSHIKEKAPHHLPPRSKR